jgi:hypothetical protein
MIAIVNYFQNPVTLQETKYSTLPTPEEALYYNAAGTHN